MTEEADYSQAQEVLQDREDRTIDALLKARSYGVPNSTLSWLAHEAGVGPQWDWELTRRGVK